MAIDFLKEIIFASDDAVDSRMISYKEKKGTLRKIAPRIYTTNMIDSPESIVKRNLIEILNRLFQSFRNCRYSVRICGGENFYELDAYLKECNAYEDPDVAKLKVIDRIGIKS